jgi:hypothetical protein
MTNDDIKRMTRRHEVLVRVVDKLGLRVEGATLPNDPAPADLLAHAMGLAETNVVAYGLLVLREEVQVLRAALQGGHLDDHLAQLACCRIAARMEVLEDLTHQIVNGCLDEVLAAEDAEVRRAS